MKSFRDPKKNLRIFNVFSYVLMFIKESMKFLYFTKILNGLKIFELWNLHKCFQEKQLRFLWEHFEGLDHFGTIIKYFCLTNKFIDISKRISNIHAVSIFYFDDLG